MAGAQILQCVDLLQPHFPRLPLLSASSWRSQLLSLITPPPHQDLSEPWSLHHCLCPSPWPSERACTGTRSDRSGEDAAAEALSRAKAFPGRLWQAGNEAGEFCSWVTTALPTTFSHSPRGWLSQQQHKEPQENSHTWALSIILTIMIYKKVFFSGNCDKLLYIIWERRWGPGHVEVKPYFPEEATEGNGPLPLGPDTGLSGFPFKE